MITDFLGGGGGGSALGGSGGLLVAHFGQRQSFG